MAMSAAARATPAESTQVAAEAPYTSRDSASPEGGEAAPSAKASGTSAAPTNAEVPAKPIMKSIDCRKVRCIALTFDDGPGPYTGQVVSALQAKGAKATFFMLGSQVGGREATVRSVKDAGMEIGNHSFNHPDLRGLKSAGIRSQFQRADAALAKAGARATLYRPPYGALNSTVRSVLSDRPILLWGVDTLDWKTQSSASTLRSASRAPRGAIILMHDIHRSTANAIPGIVSALQARGYHLVTVSELLRAPRPGKVYTGPYAR